MLVLPEPEGPEITITNSRFFIIASIVSRLDFLIFPKLSYRYTKTNVEGLPFQIRPFSL
jgi:hypothetical protein